ncbi:hypothetical protein GGS24DRAFT_485926 [Hypoxylon argillaceum]|nr:hypothetical protein GGS24DRAFT_485926 [Hypoxylon argillaceum]
MGALGLEISAAGTVDFNVEIITSTNPGYLHSHLDHWLPTSFATASTAKQTSLSLSLNPSYATPDAGGSGSPALIATQLSAQPAANTTEPLCHPLFRTSLPMISTPATQ